jgi:hypothetical protein
MTVLSDFRPASLSLAPMIAAVVPIPRPARTVLTKAASTIRGVLPVSQASSPPECTVYNRVVVSEVLALSINFLLYKGWEHLWLLTALE